MKPREILLDAINKYLKDILLNDGFQFSETQFTFKRKLENGFEQQIKFNGNLRNTENLIVKYGDQYMIYCSSYKNWWKKNFPDIGIIGAGFIDTNSDDLAKMNFNLRFGNQYDFLKDSAENIMKEIIENYTSHGKIHFERNSSWTKISEKAGSKFTQVDALILSNQIEKAQLICNQIIDSLLEEYGDSTKMTASAKQHFDIFNSRLNYINRIASN